MDNRQKLRDASIEEYIQASKAVKWSASLKNEMIKTFLLVSHIEDVYQVQETVSDYKKKIICAELESFLKIEMFDIEKKFKDDCDDISAFKYEKLEIGYKKYKNVVDEGVLFIKRGSRSIVLDIAYNRENTYNFTVYSHIDDSNLASEFLGNLKSHAEKHNYLRKQKIFPDCTFIELNTGYDWDSVILDKKIKKAIQKNIFSLTDNIEIYIKNGIALKRGLILKGEPGVGKTMVGKVLCSSCDCAVIWVTPKFLERSHNIANIMSLARDLSPSILFLEDIDLYGSERDHNANKAILGELMNQLDGITENKNVIIIATTNRGDELEKALRNRPGRFDSVIEIPKPGQLERKEMLIKYASKFIRPEEKIDFDLIAQKTDKYTGAHIKDLIDLSVMRAISEGNVGVEDSKIYLTEAIIRKNIKRVGEKKISISDAFHPDKTEDDEGILVDPDEP